MANSTTLHIVKRPQRSLKVPERLGSVSKILIGSVGAGVFFVLPSLEKTPGDGMTIGGIVISDQVAGRFIPREGIGDLASDPLRRWIGYYAERYQPPPLVPENDQNEEQLEADRRRDQEVHGGDAGRMIVEESLPGL
jgi:hypothetical protein